MSFSYSLGALPGNGTLQVQVFLSAGADAEGADFTLQFDTNLGSYVSYTPTSGWAQAVNSGTPGTLVVSTFDATLSSPVAVSATGLVGTFTFNLVTGSQNFTASIASGASFTDINGNTVPAASASLDATVCFLAGTMIRTVSGEVPVERLAPGDIVVTWSGARRPITWIGSGTALATRGCPNAATPVIVREGALADNMPMADLHVTNGHSLLIDGVLIPVEFLVNHRSIVWDDNAREVTVYHVELDRHDILIANGAPAESYRDDGNRWLFRNGNRGWNHPPQTSYAPVLTGGPVVDTVWRRLLDRSGPVRSQPLTEDPDLHLLVDGNRIDPICQPRGLYMFWLPPSPRSVRIVSRGGAPAELGLARDPRRLGVAIRQIIVYLGGASRIMEASDPCLDDGFHLYETDNDWRWTDGNAGLPMALLEEVPRQPAVLALYVRGAARYQRIDDALRAA